MTGENDCRAYVEHMNVEHHHLEKLLGAIHAQLAATETDEHRTAARAALQQFATELNRHFRDEECGGCLEEAANRDPLVSKDVNALTREHLELRLLVAALLERINTTNWSQLVDEFEAVAKRIRSHEAAENLVLQRVFGSASADADLDCGCAEPTN